MRPLDYLESKDNQLPRHKLYPASAAGAGFTISVYTKSVTFPSRKMSRRNLKNILPLALSLLALGPFGYAQGKLCRSVERVGFIKGFYFTLNFGMVWMSFFPFRPQLEDRIKVNRRIYCMKEI